MNQNIIKHLKSSTAVIVVLTLALLAQMPHAQYVMFSRSRDHDWLGKTETIIGAIALEIAVLVFAVRGNVKVSWGFAAFSVCVNLAYYYDNPASLWTPTNWLLSAGLPIAIALYSHEVMDNHDEQPPNTKRVTRTAKAVQTLELSEQVEQPIEQCTVREPVTIEQTVEQPVELDLSSLTTEQKRDYALRTLNTDPSANKSMLIKQLDVSRSTFYNWLKEPV